MTRQPPHCMQDPASPSTAELGRPPRHDLSTWMIADDWPRPVPVTEAEIEMFEQRFGDLFDELFDSGG